MLKSADSFQPSLRRVAVVMAGGSGERFWPLSRPERPKQMLRLTDPNRTMLMEAVERLSPVTDGNVVISTSAALGNAISNSSEAPDARIWSEPSKRNTLGALAWVAANLLAEGHEDIAVAVVTADHLIVEEEKFRATVEAALEIAETTASIVTIGIKPTRPETGYGYIEFDKTTSEVTTSGREAFLSLGFREKPNRELAEEFVDSGTFLWNSGMFFYSLNAFMRELRNADEGAADAVVKAGKALAVNDIPGAIEAFNCLPNQSIDYALMEKVERFFVIPSDFLWDDIGSWDSVARTRDADSSGNVLVGKVLAIDSESSIVFNEASGIQVGILGVSDLIVVVTDDAVLVCPKDQAQRVREIASRIHL